MVEFDIDISYRIDIVDKISIFSIYRDNIYLSR
jgi:hypothetical protein